MRLLLSIIFFLSSISIAAPQHFPKVMVVMLENLDYRDALNIPVFKYMLQNPYDSKSNGYAVFSQYYNNHTGGSVATRPSQPNYIALTSGGIQKVYDNNNHDLIVDNIAEELSRYKISWRAYAENLPKKLSCFKAASADGKDGYWRKHEPFISYSFVQNDSYNCSNIVNADNLSADISTNNMADVSFYIPNQVNDGHNGSFVDRTRNINSFLARMLGRDKIGAANDVGGLLQSFVDAGGLLIITFDEPDLFTFDGRIFTVLIGNMINGGTYPDNAHKAPLCYPDEKAQAERTKDTYGTYPSMKCNHYNLLKLIEQNWELAGLSSAHTAAGYKHAYPLDNEIGLWR
jgi:Phosphoesterase family